MQDLGWRHRNLFLGFLSLSLKKSRIIEIMQCEHLTIRAAQLLSLTMIAFKYKSFIPEPFECWINCHQFKCKLK